MTKIFLTGGAGFIGSAFLNLALTEGHDVLVYDNLSFGKRRLANVADTRFVAGDILDEALLGATMRAFAPDIVVHLAAVHFIPFCNEHPFVASNINAVGTFRLLGAVRSVPSVSKVFFASTAAVYPSAGGPLSEEVPVGPMDIYGLSKFAGEEICRAFQSATGIPTILGRFFNAFGPNETNPHLIPAIEEQLRIGTRVLWLGNTSTRRDFIHTSDIAAAVHALLKHNSRGCETFNVGSGQEHTGMDVVEAFSSALGEQIEVASDPARMRVSDRPHLLADIGKLTRVTGWRPTITLAEGIRTLVGAWQ
jgi:UDP-glucose 4-epimerase